MRTIFEIIETDNSYWHSAGIASVTVFHTRAEALTYLANVEARQQPGQSALMREREVLPE